MSGEGNVFDALYDRVNGGKPAALLVPPVKLRNSLAAMGFRGSDVFKELSELSGGEKSRLQLLMISYERRPLLILDEPTNHLDIGSREVLEEALSKFKGTLIAVSHDRYFRTRLATRTVDISEFAPASAPAETGSPERGGSGGEEFRRQKEKRSAIGKLRTELKRAEERLGTLERENAETEAALADPQNSSDYEKLSELYERKQNAESEMLSLMERIEALEHELEAAGA